MPLISLSQAKSHLRVDIAEDDALIQIYIDAAVDHISTLLNTPSVPNAPAVKAAALLIIADLYENREAGGEKQIKANPASMNLLYPFRKSIGI